MGFVILTISVAPLAVDSSSQVRQHRKKLLLFIANLIIGMKGFVYSSVCVWCVRVCVCVCVCVWRLWSYVTSTFAWYLSYQCVIPCRTKPSKSMYKQRIGHTTDDIRNHMRLIASSHSHTQNIHTHTHTHTYAYVSFYFVVRRLAGARHASHEYGGTQTPSRLIWVSCLDNILKEEDNFIGNMLKWFGESMSGYNVRVCLR